MPRSFRPTVARISKQLIAHNAAIVVEVEDRGIGVPGTGQSRVFDRYYRAAYDQNKAGILVRHVMDAHGAKAELESEPAAVDFGMVLRCN